uniref:Uncharacterized protein n=1 Tax=Prolemur simus TaxID=1328070 RepID=A0A8C9B152_PROSS
PSFPVKGTTISITLAKNLSSSLHTPLIHHLSRPLDSKSPWTSPLRSHPAHTPTRTFSQGQHPPTAFGKPRVRKPPNPSRAPRRRPDRTAAEATETRCSKLMAAMATSGNRKKREGITGAEKANLPIRVKAEGGHLK